MKSIRKHAAAAAAVVALGAGLAPLTSAVADEAPAGGPCAAQQVQLDRAQTTLAALTNRLATRTSVVREARADVRAADTARERRSARAALAVARSRKANVALARKAQVQRVAQAQVRLDACLADAPATPETPAA
jgi:hypothetical protein